MLFRLLVVVCSPNDDSKQITLHTFRRVQGPSHFWKEHQMMNTRILLSNVTLQGIPEQRQEMMDGAENVHDTLFEPKSAGNPWDYP